MKLTNCQAILCLTLIPEKLVLLRCPLRTSKMVEVVYVKFSSLNSPSTPASAAALEFKVEFSFKSKQLRTVKWCLIYHSGVSSMWFAHLLSGCSHPSLPTPQACLCYIIHPGCVCHTSLFLSCFAIIGASLSEPHTSVTALRTRVSIYLSVCTSMDRPHTVNFK